MSPNWTFFFVVWVRVFYSRSGSSPVNFGLLVVVIYRVLSLTAFLLSHTFSVREARLQSYASLAGYSSECQIFLLEKVNDVV
jgi:hypothetical protein